MQYLSKVCDCWRPYMLSILRMVTALLFLEHGTAKLFGLPHMAMFDQLQIVSLIGLAGIIEVGGGVLLLVGLYTRAVAFVLSGEMAVAYFMAHFPKGYLPIVNQGELAVLYAFLFLYLALAGGGVWSVDAMRERRNAPARANSTA
jgi:putative oxidoreductase